jgi:hypothetical protein
VPSDAHLFGLFLRRLVDGCTQATVKRKCERVLTHLLESPTPWRSPRSDGLWLDTGDVQHMALWFPVVVWGLDTGQGFRRVMYPLGANGPVSQEQALGTASCPAQIVLDSAHFHMAELMDPSTIETLLGQVSARPDGWTRGGLAQWPWPLPGPFLPGMGLGQGPPASSRPKRSPPSPQRLALRPPDGGDVSDTGPPYWSVGGLPSGGDLCARLFEPPDGRSVAASTEEAAKKPFRPGKGLDGSGPGVQECKVGFDEDGVEGAVPGWVKLGADYPRTGLKTAWGAEAVEGSGEGRDGALGVDSDDGGDGAPIGGSEDPFTGSCGTLGSGRKRRGDSGGGDLKRPDRTLDRLVNYPD